MSGKMMIGDFIFVQDSITNDILMSGTISKITDNPAGYSIDGILFMNPNSPKLKINKTYSLMKQNICFKDLITEDKYKIYKHNNIDNTFDYDFFMWNEIEPEVKEVCDLLNQIPGIETYSSCSGHGIIPPYVDFFVNNFDTFFELLDFLNKQGIPSKSIKHNDINSTHRFIVGVESPHTIHLESTLINDNFSELCKQIKKFIRIKTLHLH